MSSLQRQNPEKKWVEIFNDRVQYKLETKTYRISNQKAYRRNSSIRSLPPLNTLIGPPSAGSKSPSQRQKSIGSPVIGFNDDSVSILTDPSLSRSPFASKYRNSISFSQDSNPGLREDSMLTLRECKHTAENLIPPPQQLDWVVSWGSQLLCYLCNEPAINDCTICKKCNMVAHYLCIAESNLRNNRPPVMGPGLLPLNLKIQTSIRQSFSSSQQITNHKCPNCEEAYQAELDYYEHLILRLKEEKMMQLSAARIGYKALVFIEKCRLKKKKKMIIKIQAIARGILTRKKLRQTVLKKQQKTILLQFSSLPYFLRREGSDVLMIITTFDTFKNLQLFRFDKTYEQFFNEVILIPGFSWYQTLLITIGVRDQHGNYALIGQAQLGLRDVNLHSRKIDITLNFLEKITYIPQDVPGIKSPSLTVPIRLTPSFIDLDDFQVKFRMMPQNPVTTLSMMISAPPLDILKRAADVGVKKRRAPAGPAGGGKNALNGGSSLMGSSSLVMGSSSLSGPSGVSGTVAAHSTSLASNTIGTGANYRNSRYWICLHQLKLWFYQYYGDATPRFAADVAHATVQVIRDKGHVTSLVNLIHADQRAWVLEFSDKREAMKFETALNESKKALFEGRSVYARRDEMFETYNFGFNLTMY